MEETQKVLDITIPDFIKRNSLSIKSSKEISAKIRASESIFGFEAEVLVGYAEFDDVKDLLKTEYVNEVISGEEKWEARTIEQAVKEFLEYMEFAWGKALDKRGLSANRSIEKLSAWMWLLSRDDMEKTLKDDSLYNPYGAPALIKCCEQLDIKVPPELIEFAKHKCWQEE